MRRSKIRRLPLRRLLVSAVSLGAVVGFGIAPSAAAAATLNPPPPDDTTCTATDGGGTICRGALTTSYEFTDEFSCPQGFTIDEQGTTDRQIVFVYDSDGNITKRVTRILSLVGSFSNSSSGASVDESGHFTITHDYLTPGELSSDQTTIDGLFAKVVLPGSGIVLQDAGTIVFAPDGGVPRVGGFHQFLAGDIDHLCEALA